MRYKLILIAIIFFALGYYCNTLNNYILPKATAEVGGMDSYDLRYDYDFQNGVKAVVEDNCKIRGTKIVCY